MQSVIGSLPTFTIAIRLAWSEAHRQSKAQRQARVFTPSVRCVLTIARMLAS